MSLLTQAAPFSTMEQNEGKQPKLRAKMKNTFDKIQARMAENSRIQASMNEEKISESFQLAQDEQKSRNAKVEDLINNMNKTKPDNAGDGLANFVTPTHPVSLPKVAVPQTMTHSSTLKEGFSAPAYVKNTPGSMYSQSYGPTPYYSQLSSSRKPVATVGGGSDQLMEKLNYMIHLLEEQQKEPTQNIMEEFALYGLLGIFMIYIVDSFARVGKYTR